MFYYPYHRKSDTKKYQAMQYPTRQPSIRIDPPVELPEGRDSGASSPLPEKPRSGQQMPTRPPSRNGGIHRIPSEPPWQGRDDYPSIPPSPDTFPPPWADDYYPTIPDYEPDDDYYPVPKPTYPELDKIRRIPEEKKPSTRQQPPPYQGDTFIHNGQEYQCEWVYCCRPVGAKAPEKLEPNANEGYMDIIIWEDDEFPEYTIDKCPNALGFCMSTRNSTLSIIGRIIYPKDAEEEVKKDIEDCLEKAAIAALAAIALQIEAMKAVPESIPAVIPTMLKTAFIAGKEAFFECMRNKDSYNKLKGKLKFSVFHEQTSNEGWRRMNEKDVISLIEKLYMYSSGLILLPGVGSFDDLAKQIGLNKVDMEGIFRNAGKSVTEIGNKLKERAKGAQEWIEGLPGQIITNPQLPTDLNPFD